MGKLYIFVKGLLREFYWKKNFFEIIIWGQNAPLKHDVTLMGHFYIGNMVAMIELAKWNRKIMFGIIVYSDDLRSHLGSHHDHTTIFSLWRHNGSNFRTFWMFNLFIQFQSSWASNRLVQNREKWLFIFTMKENRRDLLQKRLVHLVKECKEC